MTSVKDTHTMWPFVTGFGNNPSLWPTLVDELRALERPVTVWSAGCQIGCETYTLAMHVLDAGLTNVRILASDALAERLVLAQRATYYEREVRIDIAMGRLSEAMFARYFRPAGPGLVQVVDEARALVEFVGEVYVPQRVDAADVVMLRNIWVHLAPRDRVRLVQQLTEQLPADGLVVFRSLYQHEVAAFMPRRSHSLIYGKPTVPPTIDAVWWTQAVPHEANTRARG